MLTCTPEGSEQKRKLRGNWRAGRAERCTSGSEGAATRSRVRTCYDWRSNQDVTQCSAIGTLPRRAIRTLFWWYEALGTMYPSPDEGGHPAVRRSGDCQHQGGRGLGADDMANTCEPLINVVRTNKPKVLNQVGLGQKASGQVQGFPLSLPQTMHHRRTGGA